MAAVQAIKATTTDATIAINAAVNTDTDTGAPPYLIFIVHQYNTTILNCFIHYVKYLTAVSSILIHIFVTVQTAIFLTEKAGQEALDMHPM